MTIIEIEDIAIKEISTLPNHLFNYHFNPYNLRINKNPFSNSIILNCFHIEKRLEGYSKKFIKKIASFKEKNLEHYDQLLQFSAELIVISHLAESLGDEWIFEEEPIANGSKKNPEISVSNGEITLLVEVKSPRFHEFQKTRTQTGVQLPSRINGFQEMAKSVYGENPSLPRDNIIKDFLISADTKFKNFKLEDKNILSVLVIVWDDYIYEPISSLKNDFTGLLTEQSYYKDKNQKAVKFQNIDNIVLLRNMTEVVKCTIHDINPTSGLSHPLDYGKKGIALPKSLFTVNSHDKEDFILELFECTRQVHLEHFADYKAQDLIMWMKIPSLQKTNQ